MLIVTRRPGEQVLIGDDIVVQVVESSGSSVRIGIEARKDLPIYRREVWAAIQEENRAAASTAPERLPHPAPQRRDAAA